MKRMLGAAIAAILFCTDGSAQAGPTTDSPSACLTASASAHTAVDAIRAVPSSVVSVVYSREPADTKPSNNTTGSGFVIDSSGGLILTAAHLVGKDGRLKVIDDRGLERPATLLSVDQHTNLAVIHTAPPLSQALPLATDNPGLGQEIYGVGRLFSGHVPFLRRGIVASIPAREANVLVVDFAIESGMSGAPIVNDCGEVVGVATAILRGDGSALSFGFAVPLSEIRGALSRLRASR